MFYKTATVQVTGVRRLDTKVAQNSDIFRKRQKGVGSNLINPSLFEAIGAYYDLSSDPRNFLYITARGITADIPNNNGDAFPREELWRFTPTKNCFVYQTFVHDPLHVNHVTSNPKTARGFLLDAHYDSSDPADEFVELIIAVDMTKDSKLAHNLEAGHAKTFSMGCNAEVTQCSVCGHFAYSPREFCDHIAHYRMQHIAGQLVYEKCYGVDYTELSYVPDPADAKAQTTSILNATTTQKVANRKASLVERLGLTSGQIAEIASYYEYNIDRLPEGMIKLGDALF